MTRPVYESDADRANQAGVIAKLECAFGLTATAPRDPFAPYDVVFRRQPRPCVVEIKVRRNERGRYETYLLSEHKYNALCAIDARGADALLAVQWTDELGIVQVPVEHTVSTGGRYDRGDSRDVERVVLIPTISFNTVTE
ncbi:MAG: hypothetical protein RIR41_3765 [Pseudomonadota bacterium]|jgi:hypothetical protein